MTRKLVLLALLTTLSFCGCDKIKALTDRKPASTPAPAAPVDGTAAATEEEKPAVAGAAPAPAAKPKSKPAGPAKPIIDTSAEVVVLCYHRLEGKNGGPYSIEPALFEQHMQKIKDSGVPVISMTDFLAWRRGEKNIPPKSIIITLDDGYVSEVEVGVPILKKFGFTATFFVYTQFINSGGKSVTWAQLAELRDAGFDIGSHTVSHADLRKKPAKVPGEYDAWLENEIAGSKRIIEEKLGIKCATIAYVGGNVNDKVRAATQAAGYEAGFSVYGARLGLASDAMSLGRYDITAKLPNNQDVFTVAISFSGMAAPSGGAVLADAVSSMITEPMNGETVVTPNPMIKANLATMGEIDEGTVTMRISGLGLVAAKYDAASGNISFKPTEPLKVGSYRVLIGAKSGGRQIDTGWTFNYSPDGMAPIPEATPAPPPAAKPATPKKKK